MLLPAEVAQLERRARASKLEASVNRSFLRSLAKSTQHPAEENDPAPPADQPAEDGLAVMLLDADNADRPMAVLRSCQPPVSKHIACQSLRSSISVQAARGSGSGECHQKQQFPIDPAEIRRRVACKSFNGDKVTQAFYEKASTFAAGAPMPETVSYPRCCGAFCESDSTADAMRLHKRLTNLLLELIKMPELPHKVLSQAGLIFATEQFLAHEAANEAPSKVRFFAVGSAAGRQAHHPAQVILAELERSPDSTTEARPGRSTFLDSRLD